MLLILTRPKNLHLVTVGGNWATNDMSGKDYSKVLGKADVFSVGTEEKVKTLF